MVGYKKGLMIHRLTVSDNYVTFKREHHQQEQEYRKES